MEWLGHRAAVSGVKGHSQSLSGIAVAADGKTLASGCSRIFFDPEVWVWDITTGFVRSELGGLTTSVRALALSPDGTSLAAASAENAVHLWSIGSGKPPKRLTVPAETGIFGVAFSPDGRIIAAAFFGPWGETLAISGPKSASYTGGA